MDLKDLLLYKMALYSQFSIRADTGQSIKLCLKVYLYAVPTTKVHILTFHFNSIRPDDFPGLSFKIDWTISITEILKFNFLLFFSIFTSFFH